VTFNKLVWVLVLCGCGRSGGDAPPGDDTTGVDAADTGAAPGNTTTNPESSTGADNTNGMTGEDDDDATSVG